MKYLFIIFIVFFTALSAMCQITDTKYTQRNRHDVLIAGHRGNSKFCPENTMSSYKSAMKHGVDFVETDLRPTKDGVMVFLHDLEIDRTSNGKGRITEMTLEEARQYDYGNMTWFYDIYKGEQLVTVKEGMDYFKKHNQKVLYEIKAYYCVPGTAKLVNETKPDKDLCYFMVWTLDDAKNFVSQTKEKYPLLHIAPPKEFAEAKDKDLYFQNEIASGITGMNINFYDFFNLSESDQIAYMLYAAKYKLPVACWTMDDDESINKALNYQVEGKIDGKKYTGNFWFITTNDACKGIKLRNL